MPFGPKQDRGHFVECYAKFHLTFRMETVDLPLVSSSSLNLEIRTSALQCSTSPPSRCRVDKSVLQCPTHRRHPVAGPHFTALQCPTHRRHPVAGPFFYGPVFSGDELRGFSLDISPPARSTSARRLRTFLAPDASSRSSPRTRECRAFHWTRAITSGEARHLS